MLPVKLWPGSKVLKFILNICTIITFSAAQTLCVKAQSSDCLLFFIAAATHAEAYKLTHLHRQTHTFTKTHTRGHTLTPGRPVDPTLSDPVMSEDRRQIWSHIFRIVILKTVQFNIRQQQNRNWAKTGNKMLACHKCLFCWYSYDDANFTSRVSNWYHRCIY